MNSAITKEVKDGVASLLGSLVKIQLLRLFQLEARSQKQEQKFVALSNFRLYLLSAKLPAKIEQSFNFLEISALESTSSNKLTISLDTKKLSLKCIKTDDIGVDELVFIIFESLVNAFPGLSTEKLITKVELNPSSRSEDILRRVTEVSRPFNPCGNLSVAYMFMSDRLGIPFMDDVIWDIDTIYQSQDVRELSLVDFEHLEMKYCQPIIAALRYNQWFTKLNVSTSKLTPEIICEILEVLKSNSTLTEIVANNLGLKSDFAQKFSASVMSNKTCSLTSIDISTNFLEDKGLNFVCLASNVLTKITSLNISNCNLTSKSVGKLFEVLLSIRPSPLSSINLSDNILRDEIPSFQKFLSFFNCLTTLKLSGTEYCLEQLFVALSSGCCQNLVHLDLSRNVYASKRSGRDSNLSNSCFQFFSNAAVLQVVNLSSCKITQEGIKQVLQGLASNNFVKSLELNLSCNNFGMGGALVLESFLPTVHNIEKLDISDNGFEQALESVVTTVLKTKGLKKLCLGKNFFALKLKSFPRAIGPLVELLQSQTTTLECLMLDDLKMKAATNIILNALGTNIILKEIDLSGNQMGDIGIRMLSKAIQINNHLTTMYLDGNNTSPQGFAYLALAINVNSTLTKMPTPFFDVTAAIKINPEKTFQALKDIENTLQRNRSSKLNPSDQNYRLQQCFLSGTSQQDLDKVVIHLQDLIRFLRRFDLTNDELNQVNDAIKLFKEAQSVSQVFLLLHKKVASGLESDSGAICMKLSNVFDDVEGVIAQQLQVTLSDSVKSLEDSYPSIFKKSTLKEELTSYCAQRCTLPKDFLGSSEIGTTKINIVNKVSDLYLAMNTYMIIRLVEEMIHRLDTEIQSLHLVYAKYLKLNETKVRANEDYSENNLEKNGSIVREKIENFPNLRNSMNGRMLRPLTLYGSERLSDLSDDSKTSNGCESKLPNDQKDLPNSDQKKQLRDEKKITARDSILEYIKREGPQLDHKSKDRPMRTKTKTSQSSLGYLGRSLTSLDIDNDDVIDDDGTNSSDASVFSPSLESTLSLNGPDFQTSSINLNDNDKVQDSVSDSSQRRAASPASLSAISPASLSATSPASLSATSRHSLSATPSASLSATLPSPQFATLPKPQSAGTPDPVESGAPTETASAPTAAVPAAAAPTAAAAPVITRKESMRSTLYGVKNSIVSTIKPVNPVLNKPKTLDLKTPTEKKNEPPSTKLSPGTAWSGIPGGVVGAGGIGGKLARFSTLQKSVPPSTIVEGKINKSEYELNGDKEKGKQN